VRQAQLGRQAGAAAAAHDAARKKGAPVETRGAGSDWSWAWHTFRAQLTPLEQRLT
jgi:hypothetical protein